MIHSCRTRADFDRLRHEGVRVSGTRLWVRHVNDSTCTPPRVAFALSRRNGSAPMRNRLRRQVKAILRDPEFALPGGLYLIGHRGPIASTPAADLRVELERLVADRGRAR